MAKLYPHNVDDADDVDARMLDQTAFILLVAIRYVPWRRMGPSDEFTLESDGKPHNWPMLQHIELVLVAARSLFVVHVQRPVS